jgi:hypothetical protein
MISAAPLNKRSAAHTATEILQEINAEGVPAGRFIEIFSLNRTVSSIFLSCFSQKTISLRDKRLGFRTQSGNPE